MWKGIVQKRYSEVVKLFPDQQLAVKIDGMEINPNNSKSQVKLQT